MRYLFETPFELKSREITWANNIYFSYTHRKNFDTFGKIKILVVDISRVWYLPSGPILLIRLVFNLRMDESHAQKFAGWNCFSISAATLNWETNKIPFHAF